MLRKLGKVLTLGVLVNILALSLLTKGVLALEYGGIGGKPAFPDSNNPRSESIFIFTIEPGKTKKDGILVVNNTQQKKTLLVYATDSQRSSDGSFACEQLLDDKNSVGNWIELEKNEVTLAPNTNAIVNFTVTAPESIDIGEHNGCILIQEKSIAQSEGGGVSLSFRTGVRVAVTIPGEQIRNLSIQGFDIKNQDNKIKSVLSVKNNGNVSIDAKVKLFIESVFGAKTQVADNQYPIIRGDTSTYNFELPSQDLGGFYKVNALITYDESPDAKIGVNTQSPQKELSTQSGLIFLMPSPLFIGVYAFAVIGILIFVFVLYRRIQFYKTVKSTWEKIAVTSEDNIQSIAKRYHIDWKKLAMVNKIKAPYTFSSRMSILVPPKTPGRSK